MSDNGRSYDFEDSSIDRLQILQFPDGRLGHASTVWDAALVLCAFLESDVGRRLIMGTTIIELGSGTGVCSLAASVLGATCVATDLGHCVPFIQQNLARNPQATSCTAETLDWTSPTPAHMIGIFDWVICADCVYFLPTVPALIATISALNPKRGVIVSNERRESPGNALAEEQFTVALTKMGYLGRKVAQEVIKPEWRCNDIDVVIYARVHRR